MKIIPVTKFQTEDGQKFDTLQEAEYHMDVLDLAEDIMDECHMVSETLARGIAEYLYDNYEITRIPQPMLPAQD